MVKKALTTYEVADYCNVTPRTAVQWIIEGKLKAFRTPGNHSRVAVEDFVEFLNKYKIPIPADFSDMWSGKKKILIVDDSRSMVESLRAMLSPKTYDIEVAYDGFDAGEKFASFKPDLILLDIVMPGLDGYEVCARIRRRPENKHVKIMVISGEINDETIGKIKEVGADDYLSKTFDALELRKKVVNLLNVSR